MVALDAGLLGPIYVKQRHGQPHSHEEKCDNLQSLRATLVLRLPVPLQGHFVRLHRRVFDVPEVRDCTERCLQKEPQHIFDRRIASQESFSKIEG